MVLFLLFVVLPIAELFVFVLASQAWGFFNALGVLLLASLLGLFVVRHQGLRVWRHFQQVLAAGARPERVILDGVLLLLAGVLLLVPGFITGVAGLLLLLPPVRAGLRWLVMRRVVRFGPVRVIRATYGGPIDVEGREQPPDPGDRPPRGELGP